MNRALLLTFLMGAFLADERNDFETEESIVIEDVHETPETPEPDQKE